MSWVTTLLDGIKEAFLESRHPREDDESYYEDYPQDYPQAYTPDELEEELEPRHSTYPRDIPLHFNAPPSEDDERKN